MPKKISIHVDGASAAVYIEDIGQWALGDVYDELLRPIVLALGYDDNALRSIVGTIQ